MPGERINHDFQHLGDIGKVLKAMFRKPLHVKPAQKHHACHNRASSAAAPLTGVGHTSDEVVDSVDFGTRIM